MPIAPPVNACTATDCAYNDEQQCRALAITVGNPTSHTCDTYMPAADKGGIEMTVAGVGACKASTCKHNKNLTCQAAEVKIGMNAGEVRCLTFDAS